MIRMHASRGQAVVETAIALPVFLIALLGVIWAMKDASLSARAHLAVRYGGMVDSLSQPYLSYSLYNLYSNIDNVAPAGVTTCYPGNASQLTTGYASFWKPLATGTIFGTCPSTVVLVKSPEVYTQPFLLRDDFASISASAPTGGFLSSAVFKGATSTSVKAQENFFRSPDLGTIINCTTLGAAIKVSLEGQTDPSTGSTSSVPSSVSTPLPTTITPTALVGTTTSAPLCATPSYTNPSAPY